MQKFSLEFILHAPQSCPETISSALTEFAAVQEVSPFSPDGQAEGDFRVRLDTEDPTVIFDLCAQFGRIRQAKINEVK